MRFILITFFLVISTGIINAQYAGEIVKFETESIHLGKVKKGEILTRTFEFTNISKEDVQIDMVSTCECTDANWTVTKIAPGDKGTIEFTFDSNKKDIVEPVSVDVYFFNENPKTGSPYSIYLNYTFEYE